jgi:ketosteroid isomerase-like protein
MVAGHQSFLYDTSTPIQPVCLHRFVFILTLPVSYCHPRHTHCLLPTYAFIRVFSLPWDITAMVDEQHVREHFALLADERRPAFFQRVSPTVDWTVLGSSGISGHYTSLVEVGKRISARLTSRMQGPIVLVVTDVMMGSDGRACVELAASATQKSGKLWKDQFIWLVHYNEERVIDNVREWVDGQLIDQVIEENEGL